MIYRQINNNYGARIAKNQNFFQRETWPFFHLPPRPQGCVTYWVMITIAIIGAFYGLVSSPPRGTSKEIFIAYTLSHVLIAHAYFSFICYQVNRGFKYSYILTFGGLCLWFFVWGYVIPTFNGTPVWSPVTKKGDTYTITTGNHQSNQSDESDDDNE